MENLAIFFGGKSSEHDISIITAIQVMNNVDIRKYNLVPVYIDEDNAWHYVDEYSKIDNYINKIYKKNLVTGFFDKCLIKKTRYGFKKFKKIDIAINCCHGLNGEDGTLAGVFELNNIPFVGSGVLPSAIGMDKAIMKDVFNANNIPCVPFVATTKSEYKLGKDKFISSVIEKLGFPLIVKPANLGSSIGINIANSVLELENNIEIAFEYDNKILVENVVQNLREINCSCIGNFEEVEVGVLEEPKNWKTFLDFNEKYLNKDIENSKVIDVSVSEEVDYKIKELSKNIFKIFGCSGVVRIDFMVDDLTKEVYVNEINTIPGSYANYLWTKKYSFRQLINKLIEFAKNEYKYKNMNNYKFNSLVLKSFKENQDKIKKFRK